MSDAAVKKHAPSMSGRDWITLIGLSSLWSASFLFNEVALEELPTFTIVFLRVFIAALALHLLLLARGIRIPATLQLWVWFGVMGFINNMIPFSLIVWGQTQIDSGVASILNATTPLFSIFLAHFFTSDEGITPARLGGILLGVLGVAVLIGPSRLLSIVDGGADLALLGHLALLGAACAYGISSIYGRRLKGTPPLISAAGTMTMASVWLLPVAFLSDGIPSVWPSLEVAGSILALGLFSTSLAYILYFRLLASAGSVNAMLVTFLVPVGAITLGILVLGEEPGWNVFAGMGLIFAGLAAIDGRLVNRLTRRAAKI